MPQIWGSPLLTSGWLLIIYQHGSDDIQFQKLFFFRKGEKREGKGRRGKMEKWKAKLKEGREVGRKGRKNGEREVIAKPFHLHFHNS